MDYYSEKYPSFCVEEKPLDEEVDQVIDLVVKNNKIYKVKNRFYSVTDENELDGFISDCTIDCDYFLESASKQGEVILKQFNSLSYVVIKSKTCEETDEKYWTVEIVEPEFISYV